MDVKFTVGEFALLCGVSKQTLIYYDREDVIKPKHKDPHNGYRYYTADQLEQMDTICILREMGFSLSEIKAHMKNRTPENSLLMLQKQKEAIIDKISRLVTIEKRIDKKTASLMLFHKEDRAFGIKKLPKEILAVEKVKSPGGLLEVDIALKRLMRNIKKSSVVHFYQVGDTVPMESLLKGDYIHFNFAFLPTDDCETEKLTTIEKPEGLYAVQFHAGPYETMGNTYSEMAEKIKAAGMEIAGDSYEFCVLDSLTSSSPQNYCTQIEIPVRKKK